MLLEHLKNDKAVIEVFGSDKLAGGPFYQVSIGFTLSTIRRQIVRSVADVRFGQGAARIVEYLHTTKYVDQQKLG